MSAEGAMQSECRSFEIGDRHKIARQKHSSLAFLIAQFGACHRFRGTHFTLYLHAGFGQNVSTFFFGGAAMANRLSRRDFLGQTALVGAATAFAGDNKDKPIPTRVLGKTGAKVSILALGCGSRLLSYEKEDDALVALNLALDLGITYLDTAYGYGSGKSEGWVGQVMKQRRNGVFLATKINARAADEAQRILEGSMKRLQTSQVDLIHI